MDNGAYISLSKQLTAFRELSTTANNIANVNTVGFQGERLVFDDYLVRERTAEDRGNIAFVHDTMSVRDTRNGRIEQTGNPLDVAIRGDGYFSIQTDLGIRYTKAGNFDLNNEGIVVTKQGYPVLSDAGGEIVIPPEARDIEIIGDGSIKINGEAVDRIGIAEFDNPQALERVGDTMFRSDDAPRAGANESRVLQGHLEMSNVNAINQMTKLIELQRSVGTASKFIEADYELQRRVGDTFTRKMSQ
jgi:flagellar basal-body rod protein FlgF